MDSLTDDILSLMAADFTNGDLLRLSRTNRHNHSFVIDYMRENYSVVKHLSRFFPGPMYDDFRELQARIGLVIFGSTALNFFTRTVDRSTALDVMIPLVFWGQFASWLQQNNYLMIEAVHRRPLIMDEDDDLDLEDRVGPPEIGMYANGESTINVWFAYHNTLERVIGANLTCTMNFITANEAISLFPHSTFHLYQALRLRNNNNNTTNSFINTYVRRGWTVLDDIPLGDRATPASDFYTDHEATGVRYVGDRKCWCIPCVPNDHVQETSTYRFMNSWCLDFTANGAYSRFTPSQSGELRERYLVAWNTDVQREFRRALYGPRDEYVSHMLSKFFSRRDESLE
ncbi:hypothetical protein BDN72DRAFT_956727 [Pluteus cervinus]|uniref:Uncharacterized protein n=1 Tax=Pluteus cervinus TaxID=181527 RepID=A0ACD3B611_9AGAR|nr:hypothetical protein BDN72DRAFT_956727 [Pluteus cervinus]